MYKVFFNNSSLVIATNDELSGIINDSTPFEDEKQFDEWLALAENAENSIAKYFVTKNSDEVFGRFAMKFRIIEAAGGLVANTDKKYLMIFRRGKWDLPKGKIDKGETTEKAAIREVKEETGAKKLSIDKFLQHTYHLYFLKGSLVLKKTHWYLMSCKSSSILKPQTTEDIETALWLGYNDIVPLKPQMHASILDIVDSYFGE